MIEAPRGHAAMLTFSLLVAGSFSLGGLTANQIDPIALNFARFVLAMGVIGVLSVALGGITRADFVAPWRYLLLGGLFSIYFVFMFEALKTAPPVNTAIVFTLTPLMAAGFGWLLLRQKLSPRMALALAVGASGAVWVIFRGDLAALARFEVGRGEAIFFAGAVGHALYIPLSRMLSKGASPMGFVLGILIGGTMLQGVVGAGAIWSTPWLSLDPLVWATICYTAVVATAITFVLLHFATMRLPAAKVMAYTYLTPLWVIMWEIGLGKPLPPVTVLVGVALTILSLLMLLRS